MLLVVFTRTCQLGSKWRLLTFFFETKPFKSSNVPCLKAQTIQLTSLPYVETLHLFNYQKNNSSQNPHFFLHEVKSFQHMEIESLLPKPTYGGIKMFLRRRHYQRLHSGATTGGRKMKTIRMKRSPRRYWRIKTIPRLRWVIRSPLKMLTKLKNAYMNLMLRLAGKVGALNTDNIFGGKWIPRDRQVSTLYSGDAFEARLIYEISKTLVASHELYPM